MGYLRGEFPMKLHQRIKTQGRPATPESAKLPSAPPECLQAEKEDQEISLHPRLGFKGRDRFLQPRRPALPSTLMS